MAATQSWRCGSRALYVVLVSSPWGAERHAVDVGHGGPQTVRDAVGEVAVLIDPRTDRRVGDLEHSRGAAAEDNGFLGDLVEVVEVSFLGEGGRDLGFLAQGKG